MAIILLIVLGPIGAWGKLWGWPVVSSEQSSNQEMRALGSVLQAQGYARLGYLPLINSSAYMADVYQYRSVSEGCEGRLYLVEMPRNGEAQALLARPPGISVARHAFLFKGQIYDQYPAYAVWQHRVASRLSELVGGKVDKSVVYGVAITALCLPAEKLFTL